MARNSSERAVTRFVFHYGAVACGLALFVALVAKVVFDADDVVRLALIVSAVAIAPAAILVYLGLRRLDLNPLDPAPDESEAEAWERMRRRRFAKFRRLLRDNPPTPARRTTTETDGRPQVP